MQQIVWNLLSNAVKFTAQGGSVQVSLDRTDSNAQITVSDTGEGISPEFLPHVFDHFQQADGTITREHSGLGLGLAIVRHLVEMHGGSVEASSDGIGRGASFTVRLPLVAARTTESAPHGADVMAAASAKEALDVLPGWKPNVLVADIGMPEEDGYSLIEKIRRLGPGQGATTPAIALTGYVRVEERVRALAAGYQMFVPKPVEADELARIIASLVG